MFSFSDKEAGLGKFIYLILEHTRGTNLIISLKLWVHFGGHSDIWQVTSNALQVVQMLFQAVVY